MTASVSLSGNQIVIFCDKGGLSKSRSTGIMIDTNNPQNIAAQIESAKKAAAAFFKTFNGGDADVMAINANAAANAIKKSLGIADTKAEPVAPPVAKAPAPKQVAPKPQPSTRTEQKVPPKKEAAKPGNPAPEPKAAEPKPNMGGWRPLRSNEVLPEVRAVATPLQGKLKQGEYQQQTVGTFSYRFRAEQHDPRVPNGISIYIIQTQYDQLKKYLEKLGAGTNPVDSTPRPTISVEWIQQQLRDSKDDRKGLAAATLAHQNREYVDGYISGNRKETTVALFDALSDIPSFKLYLDSVASRKVLPEFIDLQKSLTENRGKIEDKQVKAADLYIRYFLFGFGAINNPQYNKEVNQITAIINGLKESDPSGQVLMRIYGSGSVDGDTLTSALLYIRRWNATHPKSGIVKPDEQVASWNAPKQAMPEQKITAGDAFSHPRMIIVGDSIFAGDIMTPKLRAHLLTVDQKATLLNKAASSAHLEDIKRQLDAALADKSSNIILIDGGVNDIGAKPEDIIKKIAAMRDSALAAGKVVMVAKLTPWGNSRFWKENLQETWEKVNAEITKWNDPQKGVYVVDFDWLGEGNPPHMKHEYASISSKGETDWLHPNTKGRQEMADFIFRMMSARTTSGFAEGNVNVLPDLYQKVALATPEGLVKIVRDKSQKVEDFEKQNKDSIRKTFDSAFNELLHEKTKPVGRNFMTFILSQTKYRALAMAATRLSDESKEEDRKLVAQAVGEFLAKEATNPKFKIDLAVLNDNKAFGAGTINEPDMRTLTAIAVYGWRVKNPQAAGGEWGRALGIEPPKEIKVEPPVVEKNAPPPERRTLSF